MSIAIISVIVPVYQGEKTLISLVNELSDYFQPTITGAGHEIVISEVFLVHDCGPDRSDLVIKRLSEAYSKVKPIWLTRNFGQHAATLAGLSSATGDWLVTLDEDGRHNPSNIADLLDTALSFDLQIVYANPISTDPNFFMRNITSHLSKRIAKLMMGLDNAPYFHSFRIIRGDIGRSLAAYCGYGVYLDVGIHWLADRIGYCSVQMRAEMGRSSGYTYPKLVAHFWRMIITSGTKPLRLIALVGLFSLVAGLLIGLVAVYEKLVGNVEVQGWTSLMVLICFFSGVILLSLGVIAEYLSVTLGISMGKPSYVISDRSNRQSE
jgi:glycosyltransferase involved in cell wall biosynthesis